MLSRLVITHLGNVKNEPSSGGGIKRVADGCVVSAFMAVYRVYPLLFLMSVPSSAFGQLVPYYLAYSFLRAASTLALFHSEGQQMRKQGDCSILPMHARRHRTFLCHSK